MTTRRHTWQEELAIIDRTLKAISDVTDPEALVDIYWSGIDELIRIDDYAAVSRRNVEPPFYLLTRSSRFTESLNPWTQRDRLPKLTGGLLGEIADAARPIIIEDLPSRLKPDDPAWFYLQGFQSLIALPQYDGGQALNISILLLPPGHAFDFARVPILHWQAGLFGRGTQNLVLRNQLADALAALDRELKSVGDIQRSLLPQWLPKIAGMDLAAHYVTSTRAGGDYYDFFPLHGGRWGVFIADVAGHGAPAAVLMAVTHALAHAQPGTQTPPPELLAYLNDHLVRTYTRGATFVTAFYAILDPQSRTLVYSAGGHNPPRLARNGQVRELNEAASLPLGITDGESFHEATLSLAPGDMLLLYTDGITEAMAPAVRDKPPEQFGVERLDALLQYMSGASADECIARIRSEVANFCGNAPPTDDQTLVAMRCL